MNKIKRIGIEGFRRLNNVDVEMRPMMVMIGANGVGKTSFMDALSLLAASARGELNQRLGEMGGVANSLTGLAGGKAPGISFHAEMEIPDRPPLDYRLTVEPMGQGYSIPVESLTQAATPFSEPFPHIKSEHGNVVFYDTRNRQHSRLEWEYNPLESALSRVPRTFSDTETSRQTLSLVAHYHTLDVGRLAPVKLPQQLTPTYFPGTNGENLAPFLYNLRESDYYKFESIEDCLRAAFPGFESLGFPIVAAGMVAMTWKERTFRNPIYMNQLSEGTLRFLWLVSLLHSPSLPTITMIDEPEVSLHPELLAILAELMREASDRTRLIVATHADRLVGFLKPEEVMVMDMSEDGQASMTWGDTFDLEHWLRDYALDDVWQMGLIGGRA